MEEHIYEFEYSIVVAQIFCQICKHWWVGGLTKMTTVAILWSSFWLFFRNLQHKIDFPEQIGIVLWSYWTEFKKGIHDLHRISLEARWIARDLGKTSSSLRPNKGLEKTHVLEGWRKSIDLGEKTSMLFWEMFCSFRIYFLRMVSVPHGKLAIFHHHLGEDVGWNVFPSAELDPSETWWNYTEFLPMEFLTSISRGSGGHDPLGGGNSKIFFHVQPKKVGEEEPILTNIFSQGVGSTTNSWSKVGVEDIFFNWIRPKRIMGSQVTGALEIQKNPC